MGGNRPFGHPSQRRCRAIAHQAEHASSRRGEVRRVWSRRRACCEDRAAIGRELPGRGYDRRGHQAARGHGGSADRASVRAPCYGGAPAARLQDHAVHLHARVRHRLRREGRRVRHSRAVPPGGEHGYEPHRRTLRRRGRFHAEGELPSRARSGGHVHALRDGGLRGHA